MAPNNDQFVDDFTDINPSTAAAASATAAAPAPEPTTSAPVQQSTPAPEPTPTPAPTVTAAAQQDDDDDAPKPVVKSSKVAAASTDSYDVTFGDEKLMSKSDGLDILRPDKGRVVRFALLTNFVPAKRVFNHYIEKKGTYHCLDSEKHTGICCQKLGESQPQIAALVLHYTNADPKTGKYVKDAAGNVPPIEWGIKFVRLSRSAFRRVSGLVEEDGTPTDIDITMSHRDNGIGYEYNRVSTARWKKNPELVKEVENAVKTFGDGKKLLSKLGKKVSKLELQAVLAGVQAAGGDDEADLSQVEDI